MVSQNSKAMVIAVVAGILLSIAGVSGLATWETIGAFVTANIANNNIVQFLFAILIFIASLGGIAVIIGGILIGTTRVGTGKLLISIGAGLGIIGLIFSILIALIEGSFSLSSFTSIGAIGLILSIVARAVAKK